MRRHGVVIDKGRELLQVTIVRMVGACELELRLPVGREVCDELDVSLVRYPSERVRTILIASLQALLVIRIQEEARVDEPIGEIEPNLQVSACRATNAKR